MLVLHIATTFVKVAAAQIFMVVLRQRGHLSGQSCQVHLSYAFHHGGLVKE
jgi:hypothetical protein